MKKNNRPLIRAVFTFALILCLGLLVSCKEGDTHEDKKSFSKYNTQEWLAEDFSTKTISYQLESTEAYDDTVYALLLVNLYSDGSLLMDQRNFVALQSYTYFGTWSIAEEEDGDEITLDLLYVIDISGNTLSPHKYSYSMYQQSDGNYSTQITFGLAPGQYFRTLTVLGSSTIKYPTLQNFYDAVDTGFLAKILLVVDSDDLEDDRKVYFYDDGQARIGEGGYTSFTYSYSFEDGFTDIDDFYVTLTENADGSITFDFSMELGENTESITITLSLTNLAQLGDLERIGSLESSEGREVAFYKNGLLIINSLGSFKYSWEPDAGLSFVDNEDLFTISGDNDITITYNDGTNNDSITIDEADIESLYTKVLLLTAATDNETVSYFAFYSDGSVSIGGLFSTEWEYSVVNGLTTAGTTLNITNNSNGTATVNIDMMGINATAEISAEDLSNLA